MLSKEQKQEARVNKRIEEFCKRKELEKRYLKNLRVDVCHSQSYTARASVCNFCSKGVSLKEQKKMAAYSHGFRFAEFYNNRHKIKEKHDIHAHQVYFGGKMCMDCLKKLEEKLGHTFIKSFAP